MLGRGTRARRRALAATLLCAAVGATTAAPASAEIRSGGATDAPANDQATAARDIVRADAAYDSAGTLTATVTFRAAPAAATSSLIRVFLGRSDGSGGCDDVLQALAITDPANQEGTAYAVPSDAPIVYTTADTRTVSGATVTMRVSAPALARQAVDCALVGTTYQSTVYDAVGFDLPVTQADPPPLPEPGPQPQPQPAPQPAPQPQPTPQPQPAPAPVKQKLAPPKGVQLAIEAPMLQPLKRDRWRQAKLRVANTGTKAAKRVKLKLTVPKGVSAKRKTLSLGTIGSGKRKTVTVSVRLTKKAKATSTVTARATSATKGAKLAKGQLVLKLWKRSTGKGKKPAPTPGPAPELPSLVGQAFTRVTIDVMSSNKWYGLTFLDGRWAYRGIPEGAGFPQCTAKTAGVDPENGDPTDGCLPYTYDGRTNVLTVDGVQMAVNPDRTSITHGEDTYTLSPIPAAGSTWNLALKGISVSGFWPNQFVQQNWLAMNAAGEFTNSRETIGSWGGGAMTPGGGNFASSSPDQRGTYAVLPNGLIEFRYADGDVVRQSILINRDAKTGDVDPARVGFLLDGVQYFLETDD